MSALLGICSEYMTIFASDSRGCKMIDGIRTIVTDECKKLYAVDNRQIIFLSGYIDVVEPIINTYIHQEPKNQTPENFEMILNAMYPLLPKYEDICVEITLFQYEGNDLCCYNYTDRNNQGYCSLSNHKLNKVIKSIIPKDGIFTIGFPNEIANQVYTKINSETSIDLKAAAIDIFSRASSVQIGGTMTLYALSPDGIVYSDTGKIIDTEEFPRINKQDVHMSPKHGLIITQANKKFRIVANSQSGIFFQKGDGLSEGYTGDDEELDDNPHWTDKPVQIKPDGTAILGGDIHAARLFLQEIGGQNILTYIDQKTSSYKVSYSDNAEVDSTTGEAEPNIKLSGNYIEGRGLKAYDSNNNLRVHIDGESGAFHMYNGYIEMLDSNGNALYMNPQEFITWIIDGEKKFYYDQTNNALVFGGTIDTLEDVKVGETIVVRDSNGGDGLVISAKGGMTSDSITITANSGRYIDIKTSLARLNGERILTTVDKTEIEDSIESLKTWVRENFAPKVTTNPITPLG